MQSSKTHAIGLWDIKVLLEPGACAQSEGLHAARLKAWCRDVYKQPACRMPGHDIPVHCCPCQLELLRKHSHMNGPMLFVVGDAVTRKRQHSTCLRALFHEGAGSAQGTQSPTRAPCCLCLVAWSPRTR